MPICGLGQGTDGAVSLILGAKRNVIERTTSGSSRARLGSGRKGMVKPASQQGANLSSTFQRMRPRVLFFLLLMAFAVPANADDRSAILGVWKGGMPGDPAGSMELTITPTKITGRNPRTGESLGEGTYVLDPANHTIDTTRVVTYGRGQRNLGRYSLQGKTLRWVSNSRGKNRPADLTHNPGHDQFLMVLERQ